jgi:hypothetical protein
MEGFEQVVALQSTVFPPEESYSINGFAAIQAKKTEKHNQKLSDRFIFYAVLSKITVITQKKLK